MSYIVGISVEKIQKYIYQTLDDNRSEIQKDEQTLKEVIKASNTVSSTISKDIEKLFDINKKILWISGKYIFEVEYIEDKIKEKLKNLFKDIYFKYSGTLLINYVYFEKLNLNNKEIVDKVNVDLKSNDTKRRIVVENNDILFSFQEKTNIINCNINSDNNSNNNLIDYTCVYIKNMDELVSNDKEGTNGKIAVVKADINNMGEIFSNISDYDTYMKLSLILEKKITVNYLGRLISKNKNLTNKIFPLYIAGDDIFFAVKIESVLDSILILRNLIDDINDEINKKINSLSNDKSSKLTKLVISVGVEFTNNHQPIRYYREIVERELHNAKKFTKEKNSKEIKAILGTSIAGNLFYSYDRKGIREDDCFSKFKTEILELIQLKNENIYTNTFLHNFLYALENIDISNKNNEDNIKKFVNTFLYFLCPDIRNVESKIIPKELYLKNYFMKMFMKNKKENEDENQIVYDKSNFKNVISKLKLILLLTDEKYISNISLNQFRYIVFERKDETRDFLNSNMFIKPLKYICNFGDSIEKCFILNTTEKGFNTFKKVPFHLSMLFKAKNLIESGKKEKVKTLFANYAELIEEKEIELEKDNEKQKEEHFINYRLKFNKDKFNREFDDVNGTEWLDRIILFYKYDQQRILYRIISGQNEKTKKKLINKSEENNYEN
ncbi:Cas10/Cmr2 second palm domain-containing protein [Parvimonas micra]|uniref:Cas10/Cmr2 second palm domain-containing protein n=1 Tax=Parvimonas micra TaxID=33033 RepID=UPI0022B72878|nr:hypothetical protein [Parvimonas micra]WBB29947.1 hypothetical protein NM223_02740 [Parvimonas micra]